MATPSFNPGRAARILVDAIVFGDAPTCRRWKISRRTLVRYRERLGKDPQLAQLVRSKGQKADKDWSKARLRSLRATLKKANELVKLARGPEHLADVTEHLRVLGELDIAAKVLHPDGSDESDIESADPAEGAEAAGVSEES